MLTVDDFMAGPDLLDMDISPSGRYLAEVRKVGKLHIALVRDLSTPDLKIIGKIGDSVIRPYTVIWAKNERLIVNVLVPYNTKKVIRDSQKDDDFDINNHFMFRRSVAVDPDGKNIVSLMTDMRSQRYRFNLSSIRHTLPEDPKHILMNSFHNEKLTLFKVDVFNGTSEKLVSGGKNTISFICDNQGAPRYRVDYLRVGKKYRIFELTTDKSWNKVDEITLDPDNENALDSDLVGLTVQGALTYRKKNPVTGFYELVEQNRTDKTMKVLASSPTQDIAGLIRQGFNDEVVGYRVEEDILINKYFDAERQRAYDSIRQRMHGYGFHYMSSDNQGRHIAIKSYGQDLPAGYYLYDTQKDHLKLYDVGYKSLPTEKLGMPGSTNYTSRDGASIRMYLLFPANYQKGKKYPLVIMPHGGPQARDYAFYNDFAAFIASQGYFVARPNFRGSTGYGKAFEVAGYKQWGGIMQDDLQDAAQFLIKKNLIQEGKVCLAGASYGGYAALMGLVKHGDFYQCAISINGVTQLADQIKYDEKRFKKYQELIEHVYNSIGDPKTDASMLAANSPQLQVARINDPVMIVAGTEDAVVPYKQSQMMVKALKKANKPVEWVSLEDTGHNAFYFSEDRKVIYTKTRDFLARHLR